MHISTSDELISFLEPFTFFSHVEETASDIIAYVLTMDKEARDVMLSVQDKVDGKKVKFHFVASTEKKHIEEIFYAPYVFLQEDFLPEEQLQEDDNDDLRFILRNVAHSKAVTSFVLNDHEDDLYML